jgi:formate-dependent nitrite reductase membrane component NrfD
VKGTTVELDPQLRGLEQADGRNVDPALGTLRGEGAQQRVEGLEQAHPTHGVFHGVPSEARRAEDVPTYYGQPALKAPVWKPAVGLYFYVGGAAGAASALGAAATLFGGERLLGLRRLCRWIGTAGDLLGSGLLVYDLGRPERFLNMLRVLRVTSPMSVGSWILSLSGASNSGALLLAGRKGVLGALGGAAELAAGALGLPLAGYTAVLLTNTAVPVWQGGHRALPVLFLGSAMASATALLDLFPLNPAEAALTRRMGLVGKVTELAAAFAYERQVGRVEEAARPLKSGLSGTLWRASKLLTGASLLLALLPGRERWKRRVAAGLGTAGALALRLGVFLAGRASAAEPRATFQQQRAGLGAAEITGASAVAGPGALPAVFPLPVLP